MRLRTTLVLGAAATTLAVGGAAQAAAAPRSRAVLPVASRHDRRLPAASATWGKWLQIDAGAKGSSVTGYGPGAWMSPSGSHEGYLVWADRLADAQQTYRFVTIKTTAATTSEPLFAQAWSGVYGLPLLVGNGDTPLLVFSGSQGSTSGDPYNSPCIYGAAATSSSSWTLEPWSLSNQCTNPAPAAVEYTNGVVGAAWQDLGTLKYRIGVSSTIPATGPDNVITLPNGASAAIAGIAADWGSDANSDAGDTYVGWGQSSGTSSDSGFYVKDVAGGGPTMKAPGSGSNSVSKVFGWVGMPLVGTPKGVFLAYPSNASTPELMLWKVGTSKPLVVPHSSGAFAPQVAVGPGGRLWITWTNNSYGIDVVRTNKADTRFGAVSSYPTPCGFLPSAALGATESSTWGRLDIGIKCQDKKNVQAIYATVVMVAPELSPARTVIKNTQRNTVTFRVSDVGDPVQGAVVTVDGRTATTNGSGVATIIFPTGASTGTYPVTVTDDSSSLYLPAHGRLVIET